MLTVPTRDTNKTQKWLFPDWKHLKIIFLKNVFEKCFFGKSHSNEKSFEKAEKIIKEKGV